MLQCRHLNPVFLISALSPATCSHRGRCRTEIGVPSRPKKGITWRSPVAQAEPKHAESRHTASTQQPHCIYDWQKINIGQVSLKPVPGSRNVLHTHTHSRTACMRCFQWDDMMMDKDVGGTAVIICVWKTNNRNRTRSHTEPDTPGSAGNRQDACQEDAAQPRRAPLRARLSRFVKSASKPWLVYTGRVKSLKGAMCDFLKYHFRLCCP